MKKFFFVLFPVLLIALSVSPVFAETVPEAVLTGPESASETILTGPAVTAPALIPVAKPSPLPSEPFSWEYLATITGATVGTLMIVQLLKLPLDRVWKIPTRILVYVIALILLLLATGFTMGLDWNSGLLTAINAAIVALAAMGTYEVTFAKADHLG